MGKSVFTWECTTRQEHDGVLSVHEQPKGDSSQFPLSSGPHKYYLDGLRAEVESGEVGLIQDVIVSLA